MKKTLLITIIILLLIIVIGYTILLQWTCMDDSGPENIFLKKDLVDSNILIMGFAKTHEEESRIMDFLKTSNPIAERNSYCGMDNTYKIIIDGKLTNVNENTFNSYMEDISSEEPYVVMHVAGKAYVQKYID